MSVFYFLFLATLSIFFVIAFIAGVVGLVGCIVAGYLFLIGEVK